MRGMVRARGFRSRVSVVSLLAAAAMLVPMAPAGAAGDGWVQAYVNGDAESPTYILHGWTVGATITVEIWDTAAKGTLLSTETFTYPGAEHRGTGSSKPGNHFTVTDGTTTREMTLVDLDVEIDATENTVSGRAPAGATLSFDPPEGYPAPSTPWCTRSIAHPADGAFETDFDDPVANPDQAGCSPTWDLGPGDVVKVTANDLTDPDGQSVSFAKVVDFTDDDGSIFENDITWLAQEGITKGCNPPANDMYCPGSSVTRGQMAAFLVRGLGLADAGSAGFLDTVGSIFEKDIDKLAAAGITKGCNPPVNDKYCPDSKVTRGQMAAFLVRALKLTDDGGGNTFIDDDGSIFESDIAKLAAAGITKGCNPPVNDKYCPGSVVTRGQMAAFLRRALG